MIKIGVTGSIATGKSTLLEAFRIVGVPVFSADQAVAELYAGDAVAEVEALFPGVSTAGFVDRAILSKKLAADPSGFERLEALVHPLVRAKIAQFLSDAEKNGEAIAVVEVPLLFETDFDYGFDAIAVAHVREDLQRERVLARPGMTVEKMQTILARQLPQADKMGRADYLFNTEQPHDDVNARVAELVDELRARQKSS